jgi:hypothetical protein
MKHKLLPVLTFLGFLIFSFDTSAASLIGKHVYGCLASSTGKDCSAPPLEGGNGFLPDTAVIKNPGVEFVNSPPDFTESADFGANNLKLTFGYNGKGLGGMLTGFWFFKLLDHDLKITDVKLIDSNTVINDLLFTNNIISIITDTITIKSGESLTWDFKVDVQPVPVPAALWFFATGLAGLFAINRRFNTAM